MKSKNISERMTMMSSNLSPAEQVQMIAKLADLKEAHYEQLTLIQALIELLIDKQLIKPEELSAKVTELDQSASSQLNRHTQYPMM